VQWQHAIDDCVTAAAYFAEEDPWMIDAPCLPPFSIPWCGAVGQAETASGLVFCTLYILPQYLLVLQILLSVFAAAPGGYGPHQAVLTVHRDNLEQIHNRVVAGLTIIPRPTKWQDMVQHSPIHPRGPWLDVDPAGAGSQPEAPFGAVDESSRANDVSSYTTVAGTVEVPTQLALAGYLRMLQIRAVERGKRLYIDIGLPVVRGILKTLVALTGGATSQIPIYERWVAGDVFALLGVDAEGPSPYAASQAVAPLPPYGGVYTFAGDPQPVLLSAPLAVDVLPTLVVEAEQLHVAMIAGGGVYHTVCTCDRRPQPQGVSEISALSGAPQPASGLSTTFTDGALHVLQSGDGLWHTARYPDGSWQQAPIDLASTMPAGSTLASGPILACAVNGEDILHLLAFDVTISDFDVPVTTLLRADRPVYLAPPLSFEPFGSSWSSDEQVFTAQAAVTADGSTVHVVALDPVGHGWHTVAAYGSAAQAAFGDLAGIAGWPGAMSSIACTATGSVLHVLGIFQGKLWHAVRNPDGGWPGGWSGVDAEGSPPGVGPFSAVAAAATSAGVIAVCASGPYVWRARLGPDGVWWGYDMIGTAPAPITAIDCANAQDAL
jgi:hypothetical protein